jgi:arylsulfatase
VAAAVVLTWLGVSGCESAPPTRPDVVLVTLDTTRADHLGAYGYSRPVSPEIDRFAREATTYRRAWSTDSWTLPAHASLLTGTFPTRHGAHFNADAGRATLGDALHGAPEYGRLKVNRLDDAAVTLAELFQARGYETAAFAGGPWLSPVFGLLQGYAVQDVEVRNLGGRPADELTDRAVAWITSIPRHRPLHVLVNYFDPHWPYAPPPGYDDEPGAKTPLRVALPEVNRGSALGAAQREAYIARYDGEIRFMDHHLGRLLAALRATGRYDDALIVIAGDHGETFGEHGLMEHGRWLYEEVLRVPLFVRFPDGRDAGKAVDAPVSLADLLPLVAREVGIPVPRGIDGVSIGQRQVVLAESFRDALAIELWGPRFDRDLVAAIRWPWKLILSDRHPSELYRLGAASGTGRWKSRG